MKLDAFKPMLSTYVEQMPEGEEWVYEVKYDGFRCLLIMEKQEFQLISRNLKALTDQFPEIIEEGHKRITELTTLAPIIFDGEITTLANPYKANFDTIQSRGRTKTKQKIDKLKLDLPATYLVFDLLCLKGKDLRQLPYDKRKAQLKVVMEQLKLPLNPDPKKGGKWQYLPYTDQKDDLWDKVKQFNGEGIVAKRLNSKWVANVRTSNWLKIKNWQYAHFIITSYDKKNGFFHVALLRDGAVTPAGLFTNGLENRERQGLLQIMKVNKTFENEDFVYIAPSICVKLRFIEWYQEQIRHPQFVQFLFETSWEECTWEAAQVKSPLTGKK